MPKIRKNPFNPDEEIIGVGSEIIHPTSGFDDPIPDWLIPQDKKHLSITMKRLMK